MMKKRNKKKIASFYKNKDILVTGGCGSLYKQYLHQGGTKAFAEFLETMNQGSDRFFEAFTYSKYSNQIENLFGDENLFIYVYEHLQKDKHQFLEKLCHFVGERNIPPFNEKWYNRGHGKIQISLARQANTLFRSPLNPRGILPVVRVPFLGPLSPRLFLQNRFAQKMLYRKYEIPSEIQSKIKKIYAEDNRKINKRYRLNLPESYF